MFVRLLHEQQQPAASSQRKEIFVIIIEIGLCFIEWKCWINKFYFACLYGRSRKTAAYESHFLELRQWKKECRINCFVINSFFFSCSDYKHLRILSYTYTQSKKHFREEFKAFLIIVISSKANEKSIKRNCKTRSNDYFSR